MRPYFLNAFVIIASHIHAILSGNECKDLTGIVKDSKKYTSKRMLELMKTIPESRRAWMLNNFSFEENRIKSRKAETACSSHSGTQEKRNNLFQRYRNPGKAKQLVSAFQKLMNAGTTCFSVPET